MRRTDFTKMTNAEINIKMLALENEFEAKKNNVNNLLQELLDIDNEYLDAKAEMDKRKGGVFINGE